MRSASLVVSRAEALPRPTASACHAITVHRIVNECLPEIRAASEIAFASEKQLHCRKQFRFLIG